VQWIIRARGAGAWRKREREREREVISNDYGNEESQGEAKLDRRTSRQRVDAVIACEEEKKGRAIMDAIASCSDSRAFQSRQRTSHLEIELVRKNSTISLIRFPVCVPRRSVSTALARRRKFKASAIGNRVAINDGECPRSDLIAVCSGSVCHQLGEFSC